MLFNSYIFILCFLPITWLAFILCGRSQSRHLSIIVLAFASLIFYAYWNINYVWLILTSIIVNYFFGAMLMTPPKEKWSLSLGIGFNIALLAYFKYTNFFIDNLNELSGSNIHIQKIILPLGISFFTFQQISYLIDVYAGSIQKKNILVYFAYVLFFPQLISGPIVRYVDVEPQFYNPNRIRANYDNLCKGITLFTIGLFKKVIIADGIEVYASPIFDAALNGQQPQLIEAWYGAFAYTCQLYFDFSGYSDMAVGLALMFNIRIPVNFMSPYKAKNFIEFWQRWHITLSVCFQKYLYTPIAMAIRHMPDSPFKLAGPFIVTMLIIGFWHGAGWNYVLWGGIHGAYLAINHLFRRHVRHAFFKTKGWVIFSICFTFICVVIVNVLFRSHSVEQALQLYRGMLGLEGVILPYAFQSWLPTQSLSHITYSYYLFPALHSFSTVFVVLQLLVSLFIIFAFKNSNELTESMKPSSRNLVLCLCLFFVCFISMNQVSEFLYYEF